MNKQPVPRGTARRLRRQNMPLFQRQRNERLEREKAALEASTIQFTLHKQLTRRPKIGVK